MTDRTTTPEYDWPREIFAAEIYHDHHEMSGTYVTSEHATVPRYEGDRERDRQFKAYVDRDILDSQEKYVQHQIGELKKRVDQLEKTLSPFATALQIARDAFDGPADVGHLRAVAMTYVGFEALKSAELALSTASEHPDAVVEEVEPENDPSNPLKEG